MDFISSIKNKIDALTVFIDIKNDETFSLLVSYLDNPSICNYSAFVSSLYRYNGGNIAEYIKDQTEILKTVYSDYVIDKKDIPKCLSESVIFDLTTLQSIADLTPEELFCIENNNNNIYPKFISGGVNIVDNYKYHIENIEKFGYGIFAKNKAFFINDNNEIEAIKRPDNTKLTDLFGYSEQRNKLIQNTEAFLKGLPASNVLLTGDAGTGKSATIKALINEYFDSGLRIVDVRKDQFSTLPHIMDVLSEQPLKFIIFTDDISFIEKDDSFNSFKAILEGSVSVRPNNVLVYATSNRRHIVREVFSERDGEEVHRNDSMQESVSLSERFGLRLTYGKPNKATYLEIVRFLAEKSGVSVTDDILLGAEQFAIEKSGRSARAAQQYIHRLLSNEK